MLALRAVAVLTRLALVLPLVTGARVDCGAAESVVTARGAQEKAPDCHHATSAQHSTRLPGAPDRHHHGGPAGGHCPVYHSCAMDCSFHAQLIQASPSSPGFLAPAGGSAALSLLSQLPEVPPPRA